MCVAKLATPIPFDPVQRAASKALPEGPIRDFSTPGRAMKRVLGEDTSKSLLQPAGIGGGFGRQVAEEQLKQ